MSNFTFSKEIIPSKDDFLSVAYNLSDNQQTKIDYYDFLFAEYQFQKENLVKNKIEYSELEDKKRNLENEKQIENEHINRIDKELENLGNSEVGLAIKKMDECENKLKEFEELQKSKELSICNSFEEKKLAAEKKSDYALYGVIVGGISACVSIPVLIVTNIISILPFPTVINSYLVAYALIIGYPVGGALLGRRIFYLKKLHSKSKKITLENNKQSAKQNLLESSKNLKKVITNNPNLITEMQELRNERYETLKKVKQIDADIAKINRQMGSINDSINNIQSEIDELFYRLSVLEARLLVDGIEVENVIEEDNIIEKEKVKNLGEIQKR